MHFSTLFLNWNISWSSDAHWLRVCLWVHMGVFCEVNARFCFWMPLGHWYRVMNFSKKNWANPKFSGKKCKNHKSVCITKKDNNPTKRMICGHKNICFPTYFAVLSGWTFILAHAKQHFSSQLLVVDKCSELSVVAEHSEKNTIAICKFTFSKPM